MTEQKQLYKELDNSILVDITINIFIPNTRLRSYRSNCYSCSENITYNFVYMRHRHSMNR